jgi:hypothetical protein
MRSLTLTLALAALFVLAALAAIGRNPVGSI